MSKLNGKRIVVGISGGIAAYKSIELIRLLRKSHAEVRVVLTEAATHFVTPLTLQAISANPVADSLLDPQAELAMGHIELAKWADCIVIAPATADLLARLAVGMANDLLTTICLASAAPILLAPAMNQQMYRQTIVQQNLSSLQQRGLKLIGPNDGEQACGDVGTGRMSEPHEIFNHIQTALSSEQPFKGLKITITAGPTREAIDPVRFISNHSSGKMGFALARAFAEQGAQVSLVAGPVNLVTPQNVRRYDVESAQQMHDVTLSLAPQQDIVIGCAAVADYRMQTVAEQKLKKTDDSEQLVLTLVKNPDIIAAVAALSAQRPFVVGFAAETQAVLDYAAQKLQRKNLDMICANDVALQGQGFNSEHNALTVLWKGGQQQLPLSDKYRLSQKLAALIVQQYRASQIS
ncbi:bifunctional phosphopantothenoylcysteine decarboxylase/phosphopantothenate--cysteine ligase CoaBC [Testudinibacter sp. TR-2022]|uniref:bifunctional phosphopantothenoylcysteine decarboxylase/phosphopantothenate--cysteine ligase CoaBC n=1 Tax=Testudinibacter sp. TR-2022 TaxID=2585029 RepID=UPI001118900E|nr:bifunctional phosphopantothenoylcysteine decarboxylase/phosphopantothenate--cysteine ligase CoaBC [Testudinibacter sp. TR-2022]TNH09239.1 bifunctional phosphopantothenoylcysteine decarboxylase/phosphopantothenate--cysteine ligase CoaBC [Pasteurellaceae bacterium Phil11]TNH25772.1 bifunctional phosphopantothenoylcysteine decarboxylase/phosphopantothenate--cysteine ligase CoaBC [Testudinibacter sp. TR-2022]TNH28575.1 bifunctional phosphopantothenoylcysteine decarboxylase/phosphopantothenate--cy